MRYTEVGKVKITDVKHGIDTTCTMRCKYIEMKSYACDRGCFRMTSREIEQLRMRGRYTGKAWNERCGVCNGEVRMKVMPGYRVWITSPKGINILYLMTGALCYTRSIKDIYARSGTGIMSTIAWRSQDASPMNRYWWAATKTSCEIYKVVVSREELVALLSTMTVSEDSQKIVSLIGIRVPTEEELAVKWKEYQRSKFIQKL